MIDISVVLPHDERLRAGLEQASQYKRSTVRLLRKTLVLQHLVFGLFGFRASSQVIVCIWTHRPVTAIIFLLVLEAQVCYWRKLTRIMYKKLHAAEEDLVVLIGQRQDLEANEATKRLEASIPEVE